MKSIVLLFTVSLGLHTAAQTRLCDLQPPPSDSMRYRMDLLREDPAQPGVFFLPKGTKSSDDPTFKWIIYKLGKIDSPATGNYIFINDFRILPGNRLAVVGQPSPRDTILPEQNKYSNPYTFSIWNTRDSSQPISQKALNGAFQQFRFDHNGFFAIVDGANQLLYLDPAGNPIPIDAAALTPKSILSPVYRGPKNLHAIVQNIDPIPSYTLVQCDPTQPSPHFSKQKDADYIGHLATGKFLMKKNNKYCVYDAETDQHTDSFPSYKKIGADSILLFNDTNYVFIDDALRPWPICTAPGDIIESVDYYPGEEPALVARYSDKTLSLYLFGDDCKKPPQKVKYVGRIPPIPLFREEKSLYYLTHTSFNTIAIYKIPIASGQFADDPKLVKTMNTGITSPFLKVSPVGPAGNHRFLLVISDPNDSSVIRLIKFPIFLTVTNSAKSIQYISGSRFLSDSSDARKWQTYDLLRETDVDPPKDDIGKVTLIEYFTKAPCEDRSTSYYYNYMVGTTLKLGQYNVPRPPRPAQKRSATQHPAPQHTSTSTPHIERNGK